MQQLTDALHDTAEEYAADTDDERPLGAYVALMVAYGGFAAAAALLGRRRMPGFMSGKELALGGVATFRLARSISEDTVTSPLRAPFTRFEGVSGPSELAEEVRGTGLRHAVGELLTCPFCLAQWVSTLLVIGMGLAPRLTRTVMTILAMVTAADFLQFAYSKAAQSSS